MSDALLDDLNPEQRRAVETVDGPLLVVAGAGSGKTRVLTRRIAHLVRARRAHPSEIIAITFTNKAAREMAERVEELLGARATGMWVSTFHSACARLLRMEAAAIGFPRSFAIYDDADQLRVVRDVLEDELGKDPKRYPPRGILSRISDAKNRLVGPEEFGDTNHGFFDRTVAEVYGRYQARLTAAGAMDFDDLLVHAVRFLEAPGAGERWRSRFRHVLVDEYQDTNHAQYRIVRALASGHGNVCVVGDSDQSIYSWRGADIRNILEFGRDFPDAETVRLEQNYRSTQRILDAANGVIAHNEQRTPKHLWSELGAGEPVHVVECDDEQGEARLVVGRIATALETGHAASDVAVLYRANHQSRAVEDALRRQGIEYQVIGGLRFYDRAEVKDAIGYLRVLANPADAVALRRIVNVPRRGIGDTTVSRLVQHAEATGTTLRAVLGAADDVLPGAAARRAVRELDELLTGLEALVDATPVADLLEAVLERTGYRAALRAERTFEAEGKLENLEELLGVARLHDLREELEPDVEDEEPAPRGLAGFLQELSLVSDADDDRGAERSLVTLMSLHAAKGLEYPLVFIVGMEDGLFPHQRALEEGNLEEERRICYVGMTRARERLTLTYARSRTVFGGVQRNAPSLFLAEIPRDVVEHERLAPAPGSWRSGRPIDDAWPRRAPRPSAVVAPTSGAVGAGRDAWGPPSRPTAAPAPGHVYGTGDAVRHRVWGEGLVIAVRNADEIVVRFPGVGEKNLHVAYAPIEPA